MHDGVRGVSAICMHLTRLNGAVTAHNQQWSTNHISSLTDQCIYNNTSTSHICATYAQSAQSYSSDAAHELTLSVSSSIAQLIN
eukprot:17760-Heterococcus_DN1.PRE.2